MRVKALHCTAVYIHKLVDRVGKSACKHVTINESEGRHNTQQTNTHTTSITPSLTSSRCSVWRGNTVEGLIGCASSLHVQGQVAIDFVGTAREQGKR